MTNDRNYMEGHCHVMAVALHRQHGHGFLILAENSRDYRDDETGEYVPAVHHVYADPGDGRLVDVRGEHEADNICQQWLAQNDDGRRAKMKVLRLKDESDLARFVDDGWNLPLTSYDDEDVSAALQYYLENHPSSLPSA